MDGKNGFTLIELLVVIAVIAVLMSILMPALTAARKQGRRAVCAQNEKNTGLGLFLYANDYDGKLPLNEIDRWLFDVSYWTTDIILQTGAFDRHIFYCPSWRQRDNIILGAAAALLAEIYCSWMGMLTGGISMKCNTAGFGSTMAIRASGGDANCPETSLSFVQRRQRRSSGQRR